jgi:hypothetical protein
VAAETMKKWYNRRMTFAPRQDWSTYIALTSRDDAALARAGTVEQRMAIYEDLVEIVQSARQRPGNWDSLDRWRWKQKLANRQKLVAAFAKLDQSRRERTPADGAC